MSDFDSEKAALLRDLEESRDALAGAVACLKPGDFSRARKGSWPVARVLEHVLQSERLYTQLISVFSGKPAKAAEAIAPATASEAIAALQASREALLDEAAQVDEQDFYDLRRIGHEEYSVLSILENAASHDHEHAEQIHKTVSSQQ